MPKGLALPLIGAALLFSGLAQAADEHIFAGKTIRILVGYPPGSTFDTYARLAARHIPGAPGTIVQNMPGAGGLTATKHPALPADVPSVFELAPDDDARQVLKLVFSPWAYGAPLVAPPNTPADRVANLRKAFSDMMEDPQLREETTKMNLETVYMAPDRISALVADAYGAPKTIVERTRKLLGIDIKP